MTVENKLLNLSGIYESSEALLISVWVELAISPLSALFLPISEKLVGYCDLFSSLCLWFYLDALGLLRRHFDLVVCVWNANYLTKD